MKLVEIMLSSPRDEMNDNYRHFFKNAPTLATLPGGYLFKKVVDEFGDIRYGIFDRRGRVLISYLHLDIQRPYAIVSMPSTMSQFRGQGLMSYMYNYAVLKDNLTLMSDEQQTPEARNLWKSLHRNGLINIQLLDQKTNNTKPWNGDNEPWDGNNKQTSRLIASKPITESLSMPYTLTKGIRFERKQLGMDDMGLYGPGTSTEDWWNP